MCGPSVKSEAPVRFNRLPLGFLSPVILLDSKAQQTELEWISYPPNGVSLQSRRLHRRLHADLLSAVRLTSVMGDNDVLKDAGGARDAGGRFCIQTLLVFSIQSTKAPRVNHWLLYV